MRLLVLAGGAIGSVIRSGAEELLTIGPLPWATLLVNVVGSIGLGLLIGRSLSRPAESRHIPFLGVGVMGALTTFGGVMVQALDISDAGAPGNAVLYVALSVSGGLVAALIALRLAAAAR